MPVCDRQSACKPRRQYVKRVRVVRVVMTMCVTGLCRTATGKGGAMSRKQRRRAMR